MHIGASLAIAIFIVLSCQRLPEPAFSYAPTENPEAGEAVQFTNESKNAATYNWDFGDGGSSTENSPEYLYQEAGIFGVRLTASNDSGEESIVQWLPSMNPPSWVSLSSGIPIRWYCQRPRYGFMTTKPTGRM